MQSGFIPGVQDPRYLQIPAQEASLSIYPNNLLQNSSNSTETQTPVQTEPIMQIPARNEFSVNNEPQVRYEPSNS